MKDGKWKETSLEMQLICQIISFNGLTYVNLWIYSLEVDTLHEASSSALEQSGMPSHT